MLDPKRAFRGFFDKSGTKAKRNSLFRSIFFFKLAMKIQKIVVYAANETDNTRTDTS